ncbi:MAG TPA: PIN domain-containing protein [Pyrinomonadaceae bacterium]|nr:PIN domain-containing protein [Pyrinomonadaceae bacterium]
MVIPDVNMLLYAYDLDSSLHRQAREWLENVLASEQVFLSWHTITGFLRIVTNTKIMKTPASIQDAVEAVEGWLSLSNVYLINLDKQSWHIYSRMLVESQSSGNLVMDAHLASLAASCGATLASTDLDFTRFSNIQFVNPLRP